MNERLRYKRALVLVLVLAVVLRSFLPCSSYEIFADSPSAPEADFAEEQRVVGADSSIEQIFQSPKNRRSAASGSKPEPGAEPSKISRRSPPGENLVRAKREGAGRKADRKSSPREAAKAAEKRSVADGPEKSSPRVGRAVRASRDAAKRTARLSADYEAAGGSDDGSDYAEELEDGSVGESDYRSNDLKLAEDRFVDQEERSILYDDLEEKDVVKRGVAGAEDYEELNDRVDEPEDGLEERGSLEEAAEKARARGGARVEREHASKKRQVPASSGSGSALQDAKPGKESPTMADDQAAEKKESRLAEDRPVDAGKEAKLDGDRAKLDQATSDEADQSKRNVAVDAFAAVPDADGSTRQASPTNDRVQLATEEAKAPDSSQPCDKKAADEPPDPSGASKLEEAKAAEAMTPTGAAAGVAVATAAAAKTETRPGSPESSINLDGPAAEQSEQSEQSEESEQSNRDYEKRVEEQIQRKIDSIKEEIKREIAESEKLEEIESNNAKFDELLDQQEDEQEAQDEQDAEAAASEKRPNPSKRSAAASSARSQREANGDERPTKRRKRQDGAAGLENAGSSAGSSSRLEKKSTGGEAADGKRFAAPSFSAREAPDAIAPRKRDAPREAYLVKRDRSKKKRRRRSREYERGNSREALKAALAASQPTELAASSNSVASLAENAEELGPLASEYGEAFGGLQGEPGLTLARFKRIKRVLRPRNSEV